MTILFMCVANSARSQMAEGLARRLFPQAEIQSAGSNPSQVNPYARSVMKEIDIDISQQFSKSIDDLTPEFKAKITHIITLCAEEVCPTFFSQAAHRLHWPIPDPATSAHLPEEEMYRRFRQSRQTLLEKLISFKNENAHAE